MKKFARIVSLFLIPIISIAIIMEVALRHIPNRFKVQNEYLQNHGDEVETLILGSSHAQFGINPEHLDSSAYNLANKSQTLDLDYFLLKHFTKEMPNLKNVVLRLSYTTLFEKLNQGDEQWRLKDYELYFDANVSDDLRHNFEILSVSPKQNINRLIDFYISNDETVYTNNRGWGTELSDKRSGQELDNLGPKTAKKHTYEDLEHYAENLRILEEIAVRCSKMNINLILITMPAHRSYRENLQIEQLQLTIDAGRAVARQFSSSVYYPLLDDQRFDDQDFYDADHLNAEGAKKFSRVLNQLLEQ